jgi:uncharacterized membrane protein
MFLMFICTLISSVAQIMFKFASKSLVFTSFSSLMNPYLIMGLACFAFGAGFMFIAFKMGELSVLFPILVMGYVWISLLSPLFFPTDSMNLWKWTGVIIILFSVSLLGFASPKNIIKDGFRND